MTIMEKSNHHISGYIFALLATAIWSLNFIIARGLSDQITPISLAFLRWSTASIISLPFAWKGMRDKQSVIRKHWKYLLLVSVLGVSIFNTLIYIAGKTTTAINLSMISITFPIYIMILSRIIFKESITPFKILGMVTVFLGCLYLIIKGDLEALKNLSFAVGDFWMLLAAITFAVYSILLKFKPKELSFMTFQTTTFITGLLVLLPFFIVDRMTNPPIIWTPEIFISLGYVGLFASLIAFLVWNKAIHSIGPVKTSLIYYSLPIFSAIDAVILLGESIHSYHIISLVVIISGILAANYAKNKG